MQGHSLDADLLFVGICGPKGKHGRYCGQGAMPRMVVGTLVALHRFHSAILQRNVKNSDELGNPLSLQLLALVRAQWMRSMMPLRRPVACGAV